MFESLQLKHRIDRVAYDAEEPVLRERLIDNQLELLEKASFPVIILLSGMDALGRSAAAKQLLSWMDPRHVRPYALMRPSEEELERPRMWRFWRALPPKGQVGLFLNAWYEGPTRDYFLGNMKPGHFRDRMEEILRFEELLANEGALFLKFLFMLPKEQSLKGLKGTGKGRAVAWKLSQDEVEIAEQFAKRYKKAMTVVEELVAATSQTHAPWIPLPSADARYRDLTIGRTLADAIEERLKTRAPVLSTGGTSAIVGDSGANILDSLDLNKSLTRETYKTRLKHARNRLTRLTLGRKFETRALVAMFEGNDAAGKGGSIRRVVQALDPRMVQVVPIAAPSDEEKAQPYLWRFWRHVPRLGHITIFDRSWYGRVLVERVEKFCSQADWMRAYEEIRAFESELSDYGIIVVKFWLAIDKKEQLRRFKEREKVGYKRYKITDEDWRNRRKWSAYTQAVHDMVERTSTSRAPWTLVEANDKYHARVKVLETINERLKESL